MDGRIYPHSGDKETVHLKNVVTGAVNEMLEKLQSKGCTVGPIGELL